MHNKFESYQVIVAMIKACNAIREHLFIAKHIINM